MHPHRSSALLALLLCLLCLAAAAHANYTEAAARRALHFARASYCEVPAIASWTCAVCAKNPQFSDVRVFTNVTEDTQAFMGVSPDRIVVSFRGTQDVTNWLNNLNFFRTTYPNKACVGCSVQTDFFHSFNSLRDAMWQYLQELVGKHPEFPVLITGHSLGGAMALFAAADFMSQNYTSGVAPHIELYTFGAPRVGNSAFAKWFSVFFCAGDRVLNAHEPWYDNEGLVGDENCTDGTDPACFTFVVQKHPQCSNSFYALSISDHLLSLGECTSCSCGPKTMAATSSEKLSPVIEALLAIDHAYLSGKQNESISALSTLLDNV